jgi:hypothetical protein
MDVQLDLREGHGFDYCDRTEPARHQARPSSMTRITLTRSPALRSTVLRGAVLTGALLLSGCLLLSACGGAAVPSASSEGTPAHAPPGTAAGEAGPGSIVAGASGTTNGANSIAAQQTARVALSTQSIIYTAGLTLRSPSAMTAAKQAITIATQAGGYVSGEHAVAGSPGKSGSTVSLTLKIPVDDYQAVLAELSGGSIGKQVALTQQATDVTQEVADVNSLVTSQQAAISALQGLLRRAATVSQLLQVQQQISSDESSLESLEAQQRALAHETSYATITMTLLSTQHPGTAKHKQPARRGFMAGLAAGWRALRHTTTAVLTGLGAALPFLVVLLVLAAAGYAAWRRSTRRKTGPTAVS